MAGEPFRGYYRYLYPMKWFTPIQLPDYPFSIDHQTPVLAVGSCFAEQIGQRLVDLQFDAVLNPFGILYNPASVQRCFSRLATGEPFTEADLFAHNGLWHSFLHHGRFSAATQAEALEKMNAALAKGHQQWQKADVIIVTLGTAWAYRHKASCQIVANNHKQPQQHFDRELLTAEQIQGLLQSIIGPTLERNTPPQWLLTVSPVRHMKDGAVGNNRSKAHLLTAVHEMVSQTEQVHYFPGYELLLDELRDYRFYTADHAHPSTEAVDHIWSRFGQVLLPEATQALNGQLKALRKAMQHRPLHPGTAAEQTFKQQQRARLDELEQQYPFLDLSSWRDAFL